MTSQNKVATVVAKASAWKNRQSSMHSRAHAAIQREAAAGGREEAATGRAQASGLRSEAAQGRDEGARIRDEAARVRDSAALVLEQAARARDNATRTRGTATRLRLLEEAPLGSAGWQELLDLDRVAAEQSYEAAGHDREAARLDRDAADKDRNAAEADRSAALNDRLAADKDRVAADKDRAAAEADRAAADTDRQGCQEELSLAEDRLTRADRLAAMGRLAAGIAHELNNPLAALLNTLTVIEAEQGDGQAPLDLATLVADARLAAERIAHVVADMRAWLHGGGEQTAREILDLPRLIDESLRLTALELGGKARVVVDLEPTPPVWGVPSRVSQVLINLILNAANALSGPKETNELHLSVRSDGVTVTLEIRDTGVGIAPAVLPHIFDPFFTTREGQGGTGLGLAMCQRIVTDHGGTLQVESTLGRGTTCRVQLPCGDAPALQPRARPAAPRRAQVLIIDDDADFTRSLGRLLASRCEVTIAANGSEGLALLLGPGARWDLVLCDLMMPVMNGRELHARLREVAPRLATALVFISGGATTDATADFLAALPNLQLQKPFDTQQLFRLIEARAAAAGLEGGGLPFFRGAARGGEAQEA